MNLEVWKKICLVNGLSLIQNMVPSFMQNWALPKRILEKPTLSGIHDMERVAKVSKHFGVPTKVVINKYDLNLKNSQDIKKICQNEDIEVLAELPFSQEVNQSIVKGMPLVEFCNNQIVRDINLLWEKIK